MGASCQTWMGRWLRARKVLANLLLTRIRSHLLTWKHQRPQQFGFTPGKSTTDRILVLRVLVERRLIFAESLEVLVMALEALHEEAKPLGLKVFWLKTKVQAWELTVFFRKAQVRRMTAGFYSKVLSGGAAGAASSSATSYIPGLAPLASVQGNNNWNYVTQPQQHSLGNFVEKRATLPLARVVGGGSTMGGMVYTRGDHQDYDHWEALGNPGWDYNSILYYFRKAEDYMGSHLGETESYHGRGGPLAVSPDPSPGPLAAAFLRAGEELGYNTVDLNGPHHIGFARPHYNIRNGVRSSTAGAYLQPALPWSNLHILHSATVTKILFTGKKAVGVLFEYEGKTYQVTAEREVVVSAGAVATPQLLLLSGVGPEEQLQDHKINVVANLTGVGQNLQDHVGVYGLVWILPGTPAPFGPFFNTTAMHQYTRHRKGPFSAPPGECGTARVLVMDQGTHQSDVGIFLSPVSFHADRGLLTPYTYGMDRQTYKQYYGTVLGQAGFTLLVSLLRPKSRGTITLQSTDPKHHPLIDPQFLSHQDDIQTLVKGIQFAMKLGKTEALKTLGAQFHDEPVPGCIQKAEEAEAEAEEEYWRCFVQHMASSFWHPVGTCKMGPSNDPLAVVDNNLRVHGVENLRVVDASVMPTIVSGGTAAATVMIAEKAADAIKTDWGIDTSKD
ncbi:Glucose dehydrogenase [FAD, quinone] [Chionoecetes opilio]|uniref:Glucose dehydrogenase [FAD, quinone] n=1 Tax=Chionoecetes opilio TaxID=41210 RepID=A0A8J5CRH0_CHIOP|nr:Glucose dehydrogenase [FAD, quinone] [Chionoecetes opilio]